MRLEYSDNPTNEVSEVTVGKPYYNLQQRFAFEVSVRYTGGRKDRYFDSHRIAQWRQDADEFEVELQHRTGPYHRKFGLLAEYEYVNKKISNRLMVAGAPPTAVFDFPDDSLYHQINGGALNSPTVAFLVVKRINGFD